MSRRNQEDPSTAAPGEIERLAPSAWATKLGKKRAPPSLVAAAGYLHGWTKHAYHFSDKPLLLTEEEFLAALKAAGDYPLVPPHKPALSELVAQRFADFKPAEPKSKPAAKAEKVT